jgi:hypothetical protein
LSAAVRSSCSPFNDARVRLVAPLEDRIAAVSHDQNLSRHDAVELIETTDRERAQFVKQHFLRDGSDPRLYDLFLNTAQFTVAQCADLIVESLRMKSHAEAVPPVSVEMVWRRFTVGVRFQPALLSGQSSIATVCEYPPRPPRPSNGPG